LPTNNITGVFYNPSHSWTLLTSDKLKVHIRTKEVKILSIDHNITRNRNGDVHMEYISKQGKHQKQIKVSYLKMATLDTKSSSV
jgi:hypothetical protein